MRSDLLRRFVFTKNITPKRLSNLLLCFYEMKTKKTTLKSLPLKLTIDPSSICNLKCPLCPTGQKSDKRIRAMMSFQEFERIINEVGDYLYEVALYNWGEPFLNKDIYKMMALLKERKIRSVLSSNLSLKLTDEDVNNIVNSGLDMLIVSLDGITQSSYEKYRVGGNINFVKENVKRISEAKKRLGKDTPFLVWQFIVNKFNENDVSRLDAMKGELGFDAVWLGRLRCDMNKEIFLGAEGRYESAKPFLPSAEHYSRYNFEKKEEKTRIDFCYFPWTTAAINADCSVSPCCALYDQKYDFGSIKSNKGFMEIWNNESYVEARKSILSLPSGKKTICHICAKNGFIQS